MSRRHATALDPDDPPPAPGARIASVETLRLSDGRVLCARRWPGTGPETLVLLHGLLDSSEGWSRLCERTPAGVVAFDLPGFGYSDAPSQGSIDGYARDVAEGLALLGVERFTLVGHSLGGAVAVALAEMMPTKVNALVLLAPAGFGRIHLAEAVSVPALRNLVQAALPFALSSRLAVTAGYVTMVTSGHAPDPALVDRVTSRSSKLVDGAREGTRAVVDAGRSADAFHRRRVRFNGPVFAVWGDRDRLVSPSHRSGVLTAFPKASIDVWRGMGHHPMQERLDDLLDLVEHAVAAGRKKPARRPRAVARRACAA
jgi:pimeloyl-ACP methyl ester carboxylesterase